MDDTLFDAAKAFGVTEDEVQVLIDYGCDRFEIEELLYDVPLLRQMVEYVRQGDTVIVESISRFARNTRDLLELVERLTAKEVEFVSKKEAIDTTTPTGKFMLTIFGAVLAFLQGFCFRK